MNESDWAEFDRLILSGNPGQACLFYRHKTGERINATLDVYADRSALLKEQFPECFLEPPDPDPREQALERLAAITAPILWIECYYESDTFHSTCCIDAVTDESGTEHPLYKSYYLATRSSRNEAATLQLGQELAAKAGVPFRHAKDCYRCWLRPNPDREEAFRRLRQITTPILAIECYEEAGAYERFYIVGAIVEGGSAQHLKYTARRLAGGRVDEQEAGIQLGRELAAAAGTDFVITDPDVRWWDLQTHAKGA